jgi:hypothetical protein
MLSDDDAHDLHGKTLIGHQEQHLVPIDWLITKVPAKHIPSISMKRR